MTRNKRVNFSIILSLVLSISILFGAGGTVFAEGNITSEKKFFVEGKQISTSDNLSSDISLENFNQNGYKGISITEKPAVMSSTQVDNTPPIADLAFGVLNEETLKGGYPTQQTQIAFLWETADGLLTYDPDGDQIAGVYVLGVKQENIIAVVDQGFVVQVSEPGTYTLLYYVEDSRGAYSNIVAVEITVVPIEDIQVFEGVHGASGTEQIFNAVLDYSNAALNEVSVTAMSKSFGDTTVKIFDETGTEVKSVSAIYSATSQRGRAYNTFTKPTGEIGAKAYTIKVKGTPNVPFRVSIGNKNDAGIMLGGIDNAIPALKNTKAGEAYISNFANYTPNSFEEYYTYTADGAATVTLIGMSSAENIAFRVYDPLTMLVQYDSNEDSLNIGRDADGFATVKKASINFESGKNYYISVYTPIPLQSVGKVVNTDGAYNLVIGNAVIRQKYYDYIGQMKSYSANTYSTENINTTGLPKGSIFKSLDVYTYSGDTIRGSNYTGLGMRTKVNGIWNPWMTGTPYTGTISAGNGIYEIGSNMEVRRSLDSSYRTTAKYSLQYYYVLGGIE